MLRTAAAFRLSLSWLMLLATVGITKPAAQSDPFLGRWAASERDRGVVVMLSIDASSTLVLPGTGPSGRTEAMTLRVRNLQRQQASATFSVDLPENEGTVDFEFSIVPTEGVGVLRVLRVDGEPADADTPTWPLRRVRERS